MARMRRIRTISDLYPRRTTFQRMQSANRLTSAYIQVFTGSPTPEDQNLVMVDLRKTSGFSQVCPSDVSNRVLRHQEGMRALYGHIFAHLTLSAEDLIDLDNAARREVALDQNPQHDATYKDTTE